MNDSEAFRSDTDNESESEMSEEKTIIKSHVSLLREFLNGYSVPKALLSQAKLVARDDTGVGIAILVTNDDDVYTIGNIWTFENMLYGGDGIPTAKEHPNPNYEEPSIPVRNNVLSGAGIRGMSAGGAFYVAWTEKGDVFSWGAVNCSCQLGVDLAPKRADDGDICGPQLVVDALRFSKVVKAACGAGHTVCLTDKGTVLAWGNNGMGQCGVNDRTLSAVSSPKLLQFPEGVIIVDVDSGYRNSYAQTQDGKVFAWGSNKLGELGMDQPESSEKRSYQPIQVCFPNGVTIKKIAIGACHCLALSTNGFLYSWGMKGPDGAFNRTPVNITESICKTKEVDDIAASEGLSACLVGGKIYYWGGCVWYKNIQPPIETAYRSFGELFAAKKATYVYGNKTIACPKLEPDLVALFDLPDGKDIAFVVEGKTIRASKAMMKRCTYFANMLGDTEWKENQTSDPIKVEAFGYREFYAFVKFLHCDVIDIPKLYYIDLLGLADYYQMSLLRNKVIQLLKSSFEPANAVAIYSSALRYNAVDLELAALLYISTRFDEVSSQTDFTAFGLNVGILMSELTATGAFKRNRAPKRKIEEIE